MRQAELAAAQHLLSLFSSPFFKVKLLFDYGLRWWYLFVILSAMRRKIRLMKCKTSSSKKIDGRCLRPRTPYPITPPPPHLHAEYIYTVYLFTQGRGDGGGGRVEPERGKHLQSWVENTNITDCISSLLFSEKHLPKSPFTGQFF